MDLPSLTIPELRAKFAEGSLKPLDAVEQLGDVLGYVSQLAEVDVSHVSLLGEANLKNRLRADDIQPSLPVAEALANAPRQDNNLFVVPRIIE